MIDFDEAARLVADAARPLGTEHVMLGAADGRVLAAPVVARVSAPPADVSAMDGYAVGPIKPSAMLQVVGQSLPGAGFAGTVGAGEAVRIFTGAPVPAGADRVVIQEHVRRDGDRATIEILEVGSNIRSMGADFQAGDVLVEAGTVLGPRVVLAAAAADLGEVEVFRRPRVRLIATGDELADAGVAHLTPGAIPESVSFGVAALARSWGAETIAGIRFKDDLDAMAQAIGSALHGADLVVVTGGASVGERDFAKAMFGDRLELIFSKVRIKPGKPVWFGRVGETLVLGLPGNPSSAMVTARLFLAPLIAGLTGRDPRVALNWTEAPLGEALGPAGDRETFSRAHLKDGRIELLEYQDSGAQRMLVAADYLVRRPAGDRRFEPGESVLILPF